MCQKYDCENKKNWVYEVRYLLNTLGLNYIWELQRELNMNNCNAYFCAVTQKIIDQFIQSFVTDISTNVRLQKYSWFKESLEYEIYLEVLNSKERNVLCRFRCSGHYLMTEKDRHLNIDNLNSTVVSPKLWRNCADTLSFQNLRTTNYSRNCGQVI